jgi:hypothetical protein
MTHESLRYALAAPEPVNCVVGEVAVFSPSPYSDAWPVRYAPLRAAPSSLGLPMLRHGAGGDAGGGGA